MDNKEQIDINRIPEHVAIIMDGNGRWAKLRNKERSYGHQVGAETVHVITEEVPGWALNFSRCTPSLPRTGTDPQMKSPPS